VPRAHFFWLFFSTRSSRALKSKNTEKLRQKPTDIKKRVLKQQTEVQFVVFAYLASQAQLRPPMSYERPRISCRSTPRLLRAALVAHKGTAVVSKLDTCTTCRARSVGAWLRVPPSVFSAEKTPTSSIKNQLLGDAEAYDPVPPTATPIFNFNTCKSVL
jgi:hypothetical protein